MLPQLMEKAPGLTASCPGALRTSASRLPWGGYLVRPSRHSAKPGGQSGCVRAMRPAHDRDQRAAVPAVLRPPG